MTEDKIEIEELKKQIKDLDCYTKMIEESLAAAQMVIMDMQKNILERLNE